VTTANGSFTFEGLRPGSYELIVAGAILLQPRRIQIASGMPATVTLHLPITVPNAPDNGNSTVSVQQLGVPENVRETLHRAYDAWMHNDLRQSRALAARALEMRPYYGPAMSLLGILELQEGHPTAAITGLLQALQYNPNSVRSYIGLASAYNQLRQNANALDALAIAGNLAPDNWQIHYETGRAYLGMGRFEQAVAEFDRSPNVSAPDAVVLHVGKAHALLGLKDYAGARAELETVLKTAPKGPYAAESRNLAQLLDAQLRKTPTSRGPNVPTAIDPHLER
jgi:tetratricopeptide (TPR) repeat protein